MPGICSDQGQVVRKPVNANPVQKPITRSLQVYHIPVTAFSPTDLFLV